VRDAGIVGLGGATFPSSIKQTEMNVNTLLLNGVECEPYITCDDMLMRERAREIISGADIIGHIIKARQCIIAIEDNKPEAIAAMQSVIDQGRHRFFQHQSHSHQIPQRRRKAADTDHHRQRSAQRPLSG